MQLNWQRINFANFIAGPARQRKLFRVSVSPPNPESFLLPLDRLLCLDLYSTSRAVTKAYRPYLEKLGLTYPQYLVMTALWEQSPLGVKDLSAKLSLDSGTLSPLLKRLEAAKLVRRTRGTEDEREVAISLTTEGAAMRKESRTVCEGMFPRFGLTPEKAVELQQTLRKIRQLMEADEPSEN